MLRKTLLSLSGSAMLGIAAVAPNVALAFGPPPFLGGLPPGLGGPPPGLGVGGGPPLGLGRGGPPPGPRVGGPAGHPGAGGPAGFRVGGPGRGFQRNVHGVQGRSGALSTSASASYSSSRRNGYGHGGRQYDRWARYGTYAYGDASANSGCYYAYSYTLQRRVPVCSED